MTPADRIRNLKFMRRLGFGAVASLCVATGGAAQPVPGRDLLTFPIGTLGAPITLGELPGHLLGNPASGALPRTTRLRIGVAALNSSQDQGVAASLLSGAVAIGTSTTVTTTIVQARIDDMLRTDTDPQSLGREIRYASTVVSAGVVQEQDRTRLGLAIRWRHGQVDRERRQVIGVDGGVMITDLGWRGARVGASSFLWAPGRASETQARYGLAGDVILLTRDTASVLRGGYEHGGGTGLPREHHLFLSGRLHRYSAFAGYVIERAYGHSTSHVRFGLGLQYARYTIGVGREDDGGVGSSYQVLLTANVP